MDISAVPTTVKNPQSNAICERMHKTVGDMLRTMFRENPPTSISSACDAIDAVLAAAQRSLRTVVHRTYGVSPGSIVFGRDMLLPIPILTDLELLHKRRQAVIDDNNRRSNSRRVFKDYQPGQQVLVRVYNPSTLDERHDGPFTIHKIHVNGTVTICRAPNVFDRLNIRRLRPFVPR